MIKDPSYWRRDILARSRHLDARRAQRRWTHIGFTRTEQDVMLGFLSIRKILEAGKLSRAVRDLRVELSHFARGAMPAPPQAASLLMVYYDLEAPTRCARALAFVCNQIVHSYVFGVAVRYDGGFDGVYFASDREWRAGVYFAAASEVVRVLRRVGEDPQAEFNPWAEVRLDRHRVQVAFPPQRRRGSNNSMHPTCGPGTSLAMEAGAPAAALQGQGRARPTRG